MGRSFPAARWRSRHAGKIGGFDETFFCHCEDIDLECRKSEVFPKGRDLIPR
jgi:hypothetical protein